MYTGNEDIRNVKEVFNNLLPWERFQCYKELEMENPEISGYEEPEVYDRFFDIDNFVMNHDEYDILDRIDCHTIADFALNDDYVLREVIEGASQYDLARQLSGSNILIDVVDAALQESSERDKKEYLRELAKLIEKYI